MQVGEDEAAGIPAVGSAREGGDTASARKCTFMELALCLAPGLDANGVSILYKSAKPALQVQPVTFDAACTSCYLLAVTAPVWCCACCDCSHMVLCML